MLWIPDGQAIRVEWYLSDGKAIGVNNISDDWLPRETRTRPSRCGFVEPDVPRDDLIQPECRRP